MKKLVWTLPGFYFPRAGGKTASWDRLWNLTEHISAMEHDINSRKETCQSTWTHRHAPKTWWTLVQKRLRTVGEFLPTPLNFALGNTASLTTWTLYNRQQANIGTCYVVTQAYSILWTINRMPCGFTLGFAMHLVRIMSKRGGI